MTFVPKSNLHSYGLREPDNDLLDRKSLNDLQTSVAEMALNRHEIASAHNAPRLPEKWI
jgi:hypothetical protein